MPRFESSRLMNDYYGVICAEEDSFNTTRDYLAQETNCKLIRSDELPNQHQVLAFLRGEFDSRFNTAWKAEPSV